jgi:hypothetical protein
MRSFFFLLLLAAATLAGYQYYHRRSAAAVAAGQPSSVPWLDSAPLTKAIALDSGPVVPQHLKWTSDPRWVRALEEGAATMQKAIALYEWQEAEGGDPIRFRREKKELYQALSPIIEGLEEMKLEFAQNPGVLGNLNRKLAQFSAATSGVLR